MTTLIKELQVADADAQTIFDAIGTRFGFTGLDELGAPQTQQQFLQNWTLKKIYSEATAHIAGTVGAVAFNQKQADLDATLRTKIVK